MQSSQSSSRPPKCTSHLGIGLGHVQAPDGSFVEDDNNLFVYGGGERRNTRYVFTADQDGTYFLKVGGRIFTVSSGSRYRAGTFKVSIREVP